MAVAKYILQTADDSGFTTNMDEYESLTNSFNETGLSDSLTRYARVKAEDTAGNQSGWSSIESATTNAPPTVLYAIDCGKTSSPATGLSADVSAGGMTVSGGSVFDWSTPQDTSGVTDPVDDAAYPTIRFDGGGSPITYTFTVPNGTYLVRLHFTSGPSGFSNESATHDIDVNAEHVDDYFPYGEVGNAFNVAVIREFPGLVVSGGTITVTITSTAIRGTISAIEIVG